MATDSWAPQINGVSVVTARMVHGLTERGWNVHVLAPKPAEASPDALAEAAGSLDVTWIDSLSLPGYADVRVAWPRWRTLRSVFDRFSPHLVHCATEFIIGRMARIEAGRRTLPYTSSYHTDFARYTASYGIGWLKRPVTQWLTHCHQHAALTLTPSNSARDELLSRGLERVSVWGRGIDTDCFHPKQRTRKKHDLARGTTPFTFLYVGRLAPEKNVPVLLEAFAALQTARPDIPMQLYIVGDGPMAESLRSSSAPNVRWLGACSRERELPALYANADAFVYASTTETLGLVVLEAMASGTPVIAVPAGGVAEHLHHEVNGLAYAAGDAVALALQMERLVDDQALRVRLSCGARRHAEQFGERQELHRLDQMLREHTAVPPTHSPPIRTRKTDARTPRPRRDGLRRTDVPVGQSR
ncbi:MAG: glycosyltransferase family 1 protein [Gemmatimonadaceae bacterium]|nr:glycosyltransferase family 1 protein [Gemmatimonadaceae bacterium]